MMNLEITSLVLASVYIFTVVSTANAFDRNSYDSYDDGSGYFHYDVNSKECQEDRDCNFTPEPYCCLRNGYSTVCCKEAHLSIDRQHEYVEDKSHCIDKYRTHTGLKCPPPDDFTRIYCCGGGYRCCGDNQAPNTEKNSIESSGVRDVGAIAGFVFLAVIVAGTLLTLATRYIKVTVRREHRGAGINSRAYIEAMNRRLHPQAGRSEETTSTNNNNNDNPARNEPRPHRVPEIFYINTIPEENEDTDDEEGPPPSYHEAMSTCQVVEEQSSTEPRHSPDIRRSGFLFRPPSRPASTTRSTHETIPLAVRKENYDPISDRQHHLAAISEHDEITIPKQSYSEA